MNVRPLCWTQSTVSTHFTLLGEYCHRQFARRQGRNGYLMILECPNCETRYEIPVDLPPEGRKVRCSSCHHVWQATPENQPKPEVAFPNFEDEEFIFKEEPAAEKAATDAVTDETDAEPAESPHAEKDDAFSESGMDAAVDESATDSAEIDPGAETDEREDAELGSGELVPARESQPIVIGKAKKRGIGLSGPVAAGWVALVLLVAGIAAYTYLQRVEVVRAFPGAAAVYERLGLPVNVRGLEFDKVTYSWETSAGRQVLEVHGEIVNVTPEPLKVPTVVFGLRTKEQVEVYQWAADVRSELLPPNERTAFSAQIPTPPKSIRDVLVRFAKVR